MDTFDINSFGQPAGPETNGGSAKENTLIVNNGGGARGRDNADAPIEFNSSSRIDIDMNGIHQLSRQQSTVPSVDLGFGSLENINIFSNINKDSSNAAMSQQPGNEQAQLSQNNANLEALQQLISLQSMQMQYPISLPIENGLNAGHQATSSLGTSSGSAAANVALLEHQVRLNQLQQLQQLQNQIFQQQIELLSGQNSLQSSLDANSVFRDPNQYHGLPTPANSAEIRPQIPPNFLSPMTLQTQSYLPPQGPPSQLGTPTTLPQGISSAPAHLAFHTHAPLLSPGDLEFELSPLTSPWLGASGYSSQTSVNQQQYPQRAYTHSQNTGSIGQGSGILNEDGSLGGGRAPQPGRRGSKRNASSSGDDVSGPAAGDLAERRARKRQSPVIRTTPAGSGLTLTGRRSTSSIRSGSISMGSTPAMKAVRAQKDTTGIPGEIVGDTPSPVDLSTAMPPPAGPPTRLSPTLGLKDTSSPDPSGQSSDPSSALSPVTPASIMNLGRLGLSSGLSSPLSTIVKQDGDYSISDKNTKKGKAKAQTQTKPTSTTINTATTTRPARKSISIPGGLPHSGSGSIGPEASLSLKPLLPGGLNPSHALHLASASNYAHHLSGSAAALNIAPSTPLPPPTPAIRKTSHKAAEQKRRDSLKTSFDDLRLLLPPLPLPNDEGYLEAMGGEAPLPGSMPPRGPPRGDVSGPNRAVSKLQLLRCGNDFIRRLKGRVRRRDEYIEVLKAEVRVLRVEVDRYRGEMRGVNRVGDDGGDDDESGGNEEEMETGVGMERDVGVEDVSNAFERVDLDKNLDAEEENAPRLGSQIEGDEADEEGGE